MQRSLFLFIGLTILFTSGLFAQDCTAACKASYKEIEKELAQHKAIMGKLFAELDELKKTCVDLSVDLAAYKALTKELSQDLQIAKKEAARCEIICQKLSKAISAKEGASSEKICGTAKAASECKAEKGCDKKEGCSEGQCKEGAKKDACKEGSCTEGACDKSSCTGDAKTCPKGDKCCKAKVAETAKAAETTPDLPIQITINKPAPYFSLTDIYGKTHQLTDYKGKYVVLEWVNFGCPFVKKHYVCNNMQELQKKCTDKGVVWLSICSSSPKTQGNMSAEEIQEMLKKLQAVPSAYLIDETGSVGRVYQAKVTPHMYVINPDQVLIYQGAIDDNPKDFEPQKVKEAKNYVIQALESAMNGKLPEVQSTQAYGCSVKYAK